LPDSIAGRAATLDRACDLGLAAALSAYFTDVHFVWSKTILWPYVQEMQARYVLWESAERFLITPPAED